MVGLSHLQANFGGHTLLFDLSDAQDFLRGIEVPFLLATQITSSFGSPQGPPFGRAGRVAKPHGLLSKAVTLSASVLSTIFDRGRLRSNLRVTAADQVIAIEQYRLNVLNALTEVEDIRTTIAAARERASLADQIVEEARLTARLAQAQYIEGEEDLWTEIDAEQLLADAEDAQVLSREEQLLEQIAMYQAMGGSGIIHRIPTSA